MLHKMLQDVVVIDLTRVLCGPFAAMQLGDYGAQVIKVENPNGGDDTRQYGPFAGGEGASGFFVGFNRNKRSVTINLKSQEGRELFLSLVKRADVVMENFRPGVMEKLDLGYETLKQVNPRIIYASASGFGTYGPYAQNAGYDTCAQAMSGIMSVTGEKDGEWYTCGTYIGDMVAGLYMQIGILNALYERERTGKGRYVEIALLDALISMVHPVVLHFLVNGETPHRDGNHDSINAPYGIFHAKDGDFVICAGNNKLFAALCNQVLQRPTLIDDPRFSNIPARCAHKYELVEIIEAWSKNLLRDDCVALLSEAGIPTAPVYGMEQVASDPHIRDARHMFVETPCENGQHMASIANPLKFDRQDADVQSAAPALGEHNREVFGQMLGISEETLNEYKQKRII